MRRSPRSSRRRCTSSTRRKRRRSRSARSSIWRTTVRLNLAVFTSDYTDMQVTYRGPAPAGVAPFITNAGKASIDGAEAELTWAPTPDWRIEGSFGYLDATIDSLQNVPLAVLPPELRAGNRLPFAPEWQGHVGVAYTAHAGQSPDPAACRCVVSGCNVLRCDQHARDRTARQRDDAERNRGCSAAMAVRGR